MQLLKNNFLSAFFSVCLFLSAFLLFLVQPMVSKMILPYLGGSAQVWNTCVFFFQAVLLLGYFYVHTLTRFTLKIQKITHSLSLILPVFFLPLGIPAWWTPNFNQPLYSVLSLLVCAIGIPFLILSTTAPLLQKWFSYTSHPGSRDPYFFYAVSNTGSLLALISYPVFIEPFFTLKQQVLFWSLAYLLLAAGLSFCVLSIQTTPAIPQARVIPQSIQYSSSSLTKKQIAKWLFLAFIPSSLMLGVTNYISIDLAPIPLIWVVPCALYLFTFILAFSSQRILNLSWILKHFPLSITILTCLLAIRVNTPLALLVPLHLIGVFIISLFCHRKLAENRPSASFLTHYYLCLSIGGAFGGIFNALLAPVLFLDLIEYPLVIALGCFLLKENPSPQRKNFERFVLVPVTLIILFAFFVYLTPLSSNLTVSHAAKNLLQFGVPALICFSFQYRPGFFTASIALIFMVSIVWNHLQGNVFYKARDYFGTNFIRKNLGKNFIYLIHGNTIHGIQSSEEENHTKPAGYYYESGPLGQIFKIFNGMEKNKPSKISVIGLGIGGMLGYSEKQQSWIYYEISPAVLRIAQNNHLFTYLRDARAQVEIKLGDGRIETEKGKNASFDLFIVDAFSSDSVPIHLITRQAIQMYLEKLKPDGLLVFHISNRYLNLEPVLGNIAQALGLLSLSQNHLVDFEKSPLALPSRWVIMGKENPVLEQLKSDPRWKPTATNVKHKVWTDDYSNLLQAMTGAGR